ncbi:gram-negative bacteria-binding protein 3-like [Anthonomus grandis grandis]|uniref:gram-negative bacteria-binding protein 3-like n=1 Tax=Anthonomus grandis grandis TaxID=2921223 RepID=UPI00216589DE|nr:gram-negative bacteria-binding protein 3-like [Anthonomus grandis grandis]
MLTASRFFLLFSLAVATFPYKVPRPKIRVFSRGFSVSIPDEEGVETFAFHGNINKEMDGLEAGQFSQDILKKRGNQWVFEDDRVILKRGDKIYFWLFVIKDRLGYRYDNGVYIVDDIALERDPSFLSKPSPAWVYDVDPPNAGKNFDLLPKESSCHCEKLQQENRVLSEMLVDLKTVRLLGRSTAQHYATVKDFVQNWLASSLLLTDIKVVSAEALAEDLVSFTVDRIEDKVRIIMAAKAQLGGTSYKLF